MGKINFFEIMVWPEKKQEKSLRSFGILSYITGDFLLG
jgi:hypothetical protein